MSCTTHAALAVLLTVSGGDLATVASADFVVAGRSDDIADHERLLSGNVVARHLDPELGTHHAIDADDLLRSVGDPGSGLAVQPRDLLTSSLLLNDSTVTGWAFAPQEGNTILSPLATFLRCTGPAHQAHSALVTVADALVMPRR